MTLSRWPALHTRANPAVLRLRARQLCYLGHQSSEIVGLQTLKGDVPADLADPQKVVEEDRKSDHAILVAAKESEEVATLATIETNLWQGYFGVEVESVEGDLAETENSFCE